MIYCTTLIHIVVSNSNHINIGYLSVSECGMYQGKDLASPLFTLDIFNCSNIIILDCRFVCQCQQCGLKVANAVGQNFLHNIASSYLLITHNMTRKNRIWNYTHKECFSCKNRAMEFLFYEHSQFIKITIIQVKVTSSNAIGTVSSTCLGTNILMMNKIELTGIIFSQNIIAIAAVNKDCIISKYTACVIQFIDCSFTKIKGKNEKGGSEIFAITCNNDKNPQISGIIFLWCRFIDINSSAVIRTKLQSATPDFALFMIIQNTSFTVLKDADAILQLQGTEILLEGPVIFTRINCVAIIYLTTSIYL